MAQNARVAALTDELVQTIIGFNPETNRRAYKHARDIATRGLRAHQYNRTNQFDVQNSFKGLDEKFRVLNRDDLADALQSRVKELEGVRNKWIPEYLSLLLQLSDRPTENSKVEALELLRPPTPPPPLTWAEILQDDPYSDEELWKDIDYGAESSDEEPTLKRREKKSKETPPSSVAEDDVFKPESCVVPLDADALPDIEKVQFWKAQPHEDTGEVEISELQAIRETLFMLAGLPSSLYLTDQQQGTVRVNQKYVFSHAISTTIHDLLAQLAAIGRDLLRLRLWARRPSSLPLIQTFEATVQNRLAFYDKLLASLQQNYLMPETPVAVSLLELHSNIREVSRPLLRLSALVAEIEPEMLVNPFAHLEALYQRITLSQMMLEKDVFDFLSGLFFECLQTYLKPIRKWMESGELGANDETFFVFENDSGTEMSSLWHDRFVLRRGQKDTLRSPDFLEPAAMKIFNTGKSVVFLKELGVYGDIAKTEPEPLLDQKTVCGTAELPLSPFPELFQSAFDTWIRSKYSLASTVLRTHLFSQCGLLGILKDFHVLYLSADGSAFQDFADAVFERMDTKQRGWNDRYLLTELARGTFGLVLDTSNSGKIMVRSVRTKTVTRSVKGLVAISVDYQLPWSIINIIQRSSMPIYQQILTFLLQTYRAKYLLQRTRLQDIYVFNDARLKQQCLMLRNQLIWISDILRSYLTETVIAQCTSAMTAAMEKAQDIDEMANIHIKYLARLQEQAILSDALNPIHRAIISILDLAVLFHDTHKRSTQSSKSPLPKPTSSDRKPVPQKPKPKLKKRKSILPSVVEDMRDDDESDSERDDVENEDAGDGPQVQAMQKVPSSFEGDIKTIETELNRLLPFLSAGLRNIGRVGAEPVWEMLAERLEWRGRDAESVMR